MPEDIVTKFPTLVRTIVGGASLDADELRTILKIAFLGVEVDLDEDRDEMSVLQLLSRMLWDLAEHQPEPLPLVSPLPLPIDNEARTERIRELVTRLHSTPARELAYAIAYLFTLLDLEYRPIESAYLDELGHELYVAPERANELVELAAAMITPGTTTEATSAASHP